MKYSKILLYLIGSILLALLLLVFKNSENEIGEQIIYFSNALKILFGLTLLQFINNYKKLKIGITDLVVFLLGFYFFINYRFINTSIFDTKFSIISLLFVVYICIRIYANDNYLKHIVFYALVISGIFLSVLSIKQVLGLEHSNHHLFKATATFYNPGQLGGYLALIIAGLAPYVIDGYARFNQCLKERKAVYLVNYILALITIVVAIMILPATGSRAAFIAVFTIACIYVYKTYGQNCLTWVKKNKVTSLIAALILLAGLSFGYSAKEGSANGRLLIWKASLQNVEKKDILFGVGCGNFAGKYGYFQEQYFIKNSSDTKNIYVADAPEFAFNEYVQLFIEYGLVGILLFASTLFFALKNLYKNNHILAYSLTALLVFAFFSYPFSLPVFLILLPFAFGAAAHYDKKIIPSYGYIPLFVVCLFIVYFCTQTLEAERRATKEWKKLSVFYTMNIYKGLAEDYQVIHKELKDNQRFLFEYGQILNKTEKYTESNVILQEGVQISSDPMFLNIIGNNYKALGDYVSANKYYQHSFNRLPNRIYPLYLQMKLYEETNQKDLLYKKAQQILDFKEKIPSSATKKIKSEAKEVLKKPSSYQKRCLPSAP